MFERLALGELRRTTGSLQAVLLALLHTRIAGEEAGSLQGGTQLGVHLAQGTADAVTDSTGLTGNTAACNTANDIKLSIVTCESERLTND